MKTIKGDLILKENTTINSNLVVEGDIKGYFNLKVIGNITAGNINAGDIHAGNINAWNIDALNINAGNINAGDINAWNIDALNINAWNIIFCDKIKIKEDCKVICKQLITDRFNIPKKEWKV